MLFVSDVHNHPGAGELRAGGAQLLAGRRRPHLKTYTLAAWADRIHIPAAQISPALAASLVAGTGKSLAELAASAETARGFTPLALPGARVDAAHRRSTATPCPIATSSRCSKAAIRS